MGEVLAEKKNWIEIALMPVVVALVGIAGKYFITAQQENSSRDARLAQIESARVNDPILYL